MNVLSECMYMFHVCAWSPWGPEEDIRLLKLELQMGLNGHMSVGIQTQGLYKINECSLNQCAIFSALEIVFLDHFDYSHINSADTS